MKTNVYVDGLNLYFRAIKGTPFKWLDLRKLAEALFPEDTISRICYFTSKINQRSHDPGQVRRQLIYLRALATLPGFEAHFGTFRTRTKSRPLAFPIEGMPDYVQVKHTEEKGTDVNLVTRLLVDGFNQAYEKAVVVSNDSDFSSAIQYVRDDLGLHVAVVNPDNKTRTHRSLEIAATYVRRLRPRHLRECQFPDTLTDAHGAIRKPAKWRS